MTKHEKQIRNSIKAARGSEPMWGRPSNHGALWSSALELAWCLDLARYLARGRAEEQKEEQTEMSRHARDFVAAIHEELAYKRFSPVDHDSIWDAWRYCISY